MSIDIRSWGLNATETEHRDARTLACSKGGLGTNLARKYFRLYQETKMSSQPSPLAMMAQQDNREVTALRQAAIRLLHSTPDKQDTPEWQALAALVV